MNTDYRTDDRANDDLNASMTSRKTKSGKGAKASMTDEGAQIIDEASEGITQLLQGWLGKVKGLPLLVEEQLKENPYKVIAVAAGVGTGVGILVGSRLVRALVLSVGSYALTEALRAYAKDYIAGEGPTNAS